MSTIEMGIIYKKLGRKLEVTCSQENGVLILKLEGGLKRLEVKDFKKMVSKLRQESFKKILVNISDLEEISSIGIGLLVFLYNELKNYNRKVVMIAPEKEVVKNLLRAQGLDKFLPFCETKEKALEFLKKEEEKDEKSN